MSSISALSASGLASLGRTPQASGQKKVFEPPPEIRQQLESKFNQAAEELGIDASQFSEIQGKLRDALGKLDLSGSSDPRAEIEATVNATLEESGVDAQAFKADFEKILNKLGVPKPGELGQGGFPGGGFGSFGGAGASNASQQQQLLQTLLDTVGGGEDESGSRIASFLRSAPAGTFVDAEA